MTDEIKDDNTESPKAEDSKGHSQVVSDPLLSAPPELSDEERKYRTRSEPHRRLNRQHKPPLSDAQIQEMNDRIAEVTELRKQQQAARDAGDSITVLELDKTITKRSLDPYNFVQLRLYRQNGLLTEKDLANLREADARRAKRASRGW